MVGLGFAVIISSGFLQMKETVLEQEKNRHQLIQTKVQNDLESIFKRTQLGISGVANNPAIQKAFAERDRERLTQLTSPIWDQVSKQGMQQFHFHLPPATSFLRLHKPDKHGDDLSSFRATVIKANKTKKTVSGLEEGRGGIGFRVVTPVFYQGSHVGSVEYGMGFGQSLLENWKESVGGEFFLYCNNTSGVAWDSEDNSGLLAKTVEEDLATVPEGIIEKVMKTSQSDVFLADHDTKAAVIIPFQDYQGKTIGYIKNVQDRGEVLEKLQATLRLVIIIFLICISILTVLTFLIVSKLLAPLAILEAGMARVGKGDLTVDFTIDSRDEMERLANSFKQMLQGVTSFAFRTKDAMSKLSETESTMHSFIEQTNSSMQEAAVAANELASTSSHMDDNMSAVAKEAEIVTETAAEGSRTSQKAAGGINSINTSIKGLGDTASDLDHKSEAIGRIVELINSIADQTNLLALNAAIEAARAGEQGKGFAVVAEEVRKLAAQTTEAAGEVSSMVEEVRTQVQSVVTAVQSSAGEMESATQTVNETERSFAHIAEALNDMSERVKASLEGVKQVNSSSQQVAAVVQEQTSATQEIGAVSETLDSLAGDLKQQLTWFKLKEDSEDIRNDA